MPSFGEKLKAEREKRSITLEQISVSTKIGTRMLQALEEDKFNQLPGGVFNKGFVRAYARYVGINEDRAVVDYLEAVGESAPTRMGSDPDGALGKLAPGLEPAPQPASSEKSRELPWGLFAAALLAIALGLSLWTHQRRTNSRISAPADATQSSAASAGETISRNSAPANTGTAGNAKSTVQEKAGPFRKIETNHASSKAASGGQATSIETASLGQQVSSPELTSSRLPPADADQFTVLLQMREDSWISITADGKTLPSYMADAGTQQLVHGRQRVMVKAGNVGGIDFLFNGKKLAPQGESGQVKTLTFDPRGLQATPPAAETQ